MTIGALIRLLIVTAWLTLFVRHLVTHLAPAFGLDQGHDIGVVLRANLGREFLYDLVQEGESFRIRLKRAVLDVDTLRPQGKVSIVL